MILAVIAIALLYLQGPTATVPEIRVATVTGSATLISTDGRQTLLTDGQSVPVGTRLDLELVLDGETLRLSATVARIQEPSWASPGGVGIRFEELDDETRAAIVCHVEAAKNDTF